MKHRTLPVWLMVAVVVLGALFRLARLDNRSVHADEAVQAVKLGRLLERNEYIYDPGEYHGPALNYLTLPIVRLAGARKLTDVNETLLRLLPALLGIALIALVWLLREDLGRPAAVCAATLTAVSPAMVFYSRYYIAETLLVCFTFGAMVGAWRYVRAGDPGAILTPKSIGWRPWLRRVAWLVAAGVCIGLMHATKETCVVALFAMVAAAALTAIWASRADGKEPRRNLPALMVAGAVVLAVAGVVSILLFSSFFTNPRGPGDSVAAYLNYIGRASGKGDAAWHVHPWYYYVQLLLWSHRPGGGVWSEAIILVLAVAGLAAGLRGKTSGGASPSLVRFLGAYTLIATLVYSWSPYKTPWCALGFLHGMILLAGVGAVALVRWAPGRAAKALLIALMTAAFGHLAWQAYHGSFTAYEDAGNPYVYAQTTSDVPALARRVKELADAHPDGPAMHIQVICPGNDYWPLPWYLRSFGRVGWYESVPDGPLAPLVILKPEVEPALVKKLFEGQPPGERALYVDLLHDLPRREVQLRHNAPLRAFVRADLWEEYTAARARRNWRGKDQTP